MRAAVASPDEIVVVEFAVFDAAAAAAAATLAAFAVVENYATAAAADEFVGTQSYQCSDYGLAEQFARVTAENDTASASAVEHDLQTQNLIHHSDFEFVEIAREPKTVSKDHRLLFPPVLQQPSAGMRLV